MRKRSFAVRGVSRSLLAGGLAVSLFASCQQDFTLALQRQPIQLAPPAQLIALPITVPSPSPVALPPMPLPPSPTPSPVALPPAPPPVGRISGLVFNDLNRNGLFEPANTNADSQANSADQLTIPAPFDQSYSAANLGAVPGVPGPYGFAILKVGDPNTLLISGGANGPGAAVYSIRLKRNSVNDVVGFEGSATQVLATPNTDGGIAVAPNGMYIFPTFPTETFTQFSQDFSTRTERDHSALVPGNGGGIAFVPPGFPGAGRMKWANYGPGSWYDVSFAIDGSNLLNLTGATKITDLVGAPEGFAFLAPGSPQISAPSIVLSEYGGGSVVIYTMDAHGDPIPSTRQVIVANLGGAEGALFDPLSGSYLFTSFGGNRMIALRGFTSAVTIASERGLGGWTVYADLNGNGVLDAGEPTAVTDSQGRFNLNGIRPGSVSVRVVSQPGWTSTGAQPGVRTVVVTSGGSVDAGNLGVAK